MISRRLKGGLDSFGRVIPSTTSRLGTHSFMIIRTKVGKLHKISGVLLVESKCF